MAVSLVFAATTIGTNITTTGTTTLGDTTADTVTINGHIAAATTTGNLVVGVSTLATPTSSLSVFGGLHVFNGVATSSEALWVGSAGTVNNLNLTGGDLYVQDGAEIDGNITLGDTTADTITINGHIAAATTTGNFVVGIATLATPTSSLSVFGGLHVFNGVATSSEAVWVGSAGTVDNLTLTGGDLYVQDDVEIDDDLFVGDDITLASGSVISSVTTTDSLVIGGYASTTGDLIVNGGTIDNTTSTATTTQGIFARTRTGGKATSTLGVGDMNDAVGRSTGCLEMVTSAGTYVRAIIDGTAWNIAAGRCVPQ